MSQIDLRLIRAAVTVAEELSFSRAALKLHISQPALTKQIQDLEAILRVPLFIRDRQRVHMTDAGRAFVEESKPVSYTHLDGYKRQVRLRIVTDRNRSRHRS